MNKLLFSPNLGIINIIFKPYPDWKLCRAHGRSSVFCSGNVECACKTKKNKVIFEWISNVVKFHDLGAKQQVCRCASFFQTSALPCAFCKLSSLEPYVW